MEENKDHKKETKSQVTNGFIKEIECFSINWHENITVIDLSHKSISDLSDNVKFPTSLLDLKLSHNTLHKIPDVVLNVRNLKILDVSYNRIKNFDITPSFTHSIEQLNISHNQLQSPPHWVWSETPKNLVKLDLSNNNCITARFVNGYFEEFLKYKSLVTDLDVHNCGLKNHLTLLITFPNLLYLKLGDSQSYGRSANFLEHIPCEGLDTCNIIERLNLSNTHIYNVNINIDIYKKLVEINLAQNYLFNIPNEFCRLVHLQICILSYNKLLYLPDDMHKLNKLKVLSVDNNELCMISEDICKLPNIKVLDLYDNHLYEVPDIINNLPEIDLAQNYFEEPDDEEYLKKKLKLRLQLPKRCDGRKFDIVRSESEHPLSESDDEELASYLAECNDRVPAQNDSSSSPEDWDSDKYWIPQYYRKISPPPHSPWVYFVKQKMAEGNFCPMDAHPVPIAEKVKFEKLNNPQEEYESDGQFDDYSDDSS